MARPSWVPSHQCLLGRAPMGSCASPSPPAGMHSQRASGAPGSAVHACMHAALTDAPKLAPVLDGHYV